MFPELKQLLKYLEDNLNEQKIIAAENLHQAALCWQEVPRLPVVASYPYPEEAEFQPFPHGEIFDNPEKMLFNQFISAFDSSVYLRSRINDDLPVTIRPDFGCVLIASIFGAQVEQRENNPPWIRHGEKKISYEQILKTAINNVNSSLAAKVADRYKFYIDILKDYPRLSRLTNIVLPDLQGPFDNLELLRGSDVFLDMYSDKESFVKAMDVITDTQIKLAKHFSQFVNSRIDDFSFQHGFALKGGILIRNDTSIMISPLMYDELVAPFDEKILRAFGGGIHSCGNVNRIVSRFLLLKSVQCFDFGQSEMNDVETIYKLAKEKRIPLIRIAVTEEELTSRVIQEKYPTGVSLIFRAKSFEHAKAVISKYKSIYSE